MIALNTYALSDGIATMWRFLRDFEHGGLVMDGNAVRAMAGELKELQIAARRLENELSRLQWNEKARSERRSEQSRAQALIEALELPNTTVALFPVVPRPRPESAA